MYNSNYRPLGEFHNRKLNGYDNEQLINDNEQLIENDNRPFLRRNYDPLCEYNNTPYRGNVSLNGAFPNYTMLQEVPPECVIKNPFDDTKCWIDENQWSYVKWTGIGLLGLLVISKAAPLAVDLKKTLSK